jgi:hypothetical protein
LDVFSWFLRVYGCTQAAQAILLLVLQQIVLLLLSAYHVTATVAKAVGRGCYTQS